MAFLYKGLPFSGLAAMLIYISLNGATQQTVWILWGAVLLMGLPSNIRILMFLLLLSIIVPYAVYWLGIVIPMLEELNIIVVFCCYMIIAAVIGAHINGVALMDHVIRKNRARSIPPLSE